MFTPELLQEKIKGFPFSSFVIAYSGGLDSHVLLHAFTRLRAENPTLTLRAIHVNHGLSEFATNWEKHCESICSALDIPFKSLTITVECLAGESLEARARELRYHALMEQLDRDECLVTAHTQNDQAETLLLQLMRGAGPKGLAGIPEIKSLSHAKLLRPLLTVTKESLLEYALKQGLKWVEDESNQNNRFDRNFLRNDIIPQLKTRWPGVINNLNRTAQHCAETIHLMNDLADLDLKTIYSYDKKTLSLTPLLSLSDQRQRNVLRRWFDLEKVIQPNSKKLLQIQQSILKAKSDATPFVCWQQVALRRYRDHLYLCPMKKSQFNYDCKIPWNFLDPLELPENLGTLKITKIKGTGIKANIHRNSITIRFRKGGEICHFPNNNLSKPLKKCFQEWGVPTWKRRQIPLIYCDEQLIAVVGHYLSSDFAASHDEMGLKVELH